MDTSHVIQLLEEAKELAEETEFPGNPLKSLQEAPVLTGLISKLDEALLILKTMPVEP